MDSVTWIGLTLRTPCSTEKKRPEVHFPFTPPPGIGVSTSKEAMVPLVFFTSSRRNTFGLPYPKDLEIKAWRFAEAIL